MPFKIMVARLNKFISFSIKDHSFLFNCTETTKTNKLQKSFKTLTCLDPISMNIFLIIKDNGFPS